MKKSELKQVKKFNGKKVSEWLYKPVVGFVENKTVYKNGNHIWLFQNDKDCLAHHEKVLGVVYEEWTLEQEKEYEKKWLGSARWVFRDRLYDNCFVWLDKNLK